ncbi:MAG: hypothetical protein WC693_03640 [Patescibacteria group bacterium]|jgi:hypothetical protein
MSEKNTSEKRNQIEGGNEGEDLSLKKISLSDKKLEFYFDVVKYPVVFAIVINIVYYYIRKTDAMWVFDILAFVYIAIFILKKQLGKRAVVFIACGISGLFIGFFMAVFKLVYFRKFYLFFNLISEPFLTFIVGSFVGLVVAYIILRPNKKNKKDVSIPKKGGD